MTEHGVVIMQPYSFKTWGSFNGPLWQENYPQDSELRGKFRKETVNLCKESKRREIDKTRDQLNKKQIYEREN